MFIISGYGFYVVYSAKHMKSFVKKHRASILKIVRDENILEEMNLINPKNVGVFGLIADVMSLETKISFSYKENKNKETSIIFETKPIWLYSKREKRLTEISLRNILIPYAKELNVKEDDIKYIYD